MVGRGYGLCMVMLPEVSDHRVGLSEMVMSLHSPEKPHPLFDQILAVAHTISRIFS